MADSFAAPNGVSVQFKLQTASVEQNNIKGNKRFFLPCAKEILWDEKTAQLVIPFEYRPLTEHEEIAYGKKNQQEAIIAKALEDIPKGLSPKTAAPALAALTGEKRKTAEGESVSFLEHHLRQYTRRNRSDFFIHKDLKGYLLKYMLKWETRASETLLNVEKLTRPFSYELHIHQDGRTREKIADIPETCNYLLGLQVQTRKAYYDENRRYLVYRGRIDLPASAGQAGQRRIVVIWRETEGWTKEDLERDKKFVAEQKITEGADEVFINGDSFIPNAKALEPVFKARMFAPLEA